MSVELRWLIRTRPCGYGLGQVAERVLQYREEITGQVVCGWSEWRDVYEEREPGDDMG